MLPQWGCLNCIVKYKKQTYFYYEVEKKTKKHTYSQELTFPFLLVLVTVKMCCIVSSLEESKVTDGSSPPAFNLCVRNLILVVTQTHH